VTKVITVMCFLHTIIRFCRKGEQSRCCITITYEDMQNEFFLRRALRQLFKIWMSPLLSSENITAAVSAGVAKSPPKHKTTESIYASGNRYRASHHMILAVG
jgi:hypothetical protein